MYSEFIEQKSAAQNHENQASKNQVLQLKFQETNVKGLNANIDGATAVATLVATAAFGAVRVATAFVAFFGFRRGVDSVLDDRRSGLSLNLWNGFCYRFLRYSPRRRRNGGKWRDLQNRLPQQITQYYNLVMLYDYNQKIINHLVMKLSLDKLLLFKHFRDIAGSPVWLASHS
jgi:hypothetical protein